MGKLSPAEAQQLGLDSGPGPNPTASTGRGRKLSAQDAQSLGLEGEDGAAAPPPTPDPTFQAPYPDRPIEGLAYDAKSREPIGSVTGPANPVRAAAMGLVKGFSLDGGAKVAAGIDSVLPEWAGGKSYDDSLKDYRNSEALNAHVYPKLTKALDFAGTVENPIFKVGGAIGATAKGLSGVALRALSALGMGAAAGGASAYTQTDKPIDDPSVAEEAKRRALIGGATGAVAQLGIGEPLRAAGNYVGGKIASSDQRLAQSADEIIASAKGKAGKQKAEAAGAWENLDNARQIRPRMDAAAAQPARPAQMGISPGASIEDPLYMLQGWKPDEARKRLIDYYRMLPEEADDFISKELGPYLAQPKAPPPGAATAVIRKHGAGVMNELMDARVGNADRAIEDYTKNRIPIPSRAEALGQAEQGANAAALAQAKEGGGKISMGLAAKTVGGPIGWAAGGYLAQKGVRQIARAAFEAPAVLNRLRSIPGAGRAIGNAAGKGTVALETTLFTLSKQDPRVAAELEKIQGEMAPQTVGAEEE